MVTVGAERSETLILNVNDDEPNRYAVSRMLRHGGYRVVEACCGEEALALVAAHCPAVVVLDVRLPDMTGFEVCERIKRSQPSCMVLHLSALATDPNDRVTGLEHGADGYLTLPVDPRVLLATVHAFVRLQRAEAEARASSEHWQACFDAVHDGIALMSKDGSVVRCNAAFSRIFGRPMTGQRAFGPESDSDLARIRGAVEAQRHEVSRNGRWYQLSIDPLQDRDGAVLVMVDVTERKVLEQVLTQRAEDLVEGDRRKDEFLAMLAHELRNPLSAVTSALSLLPQESQRVGDVIRRQTLHVARLIDDLLDVSRIQRGRVELKRRPLNLNALVQGAVEGIRPRTAASGHALTSQLPDEPLHVNGDATRLEQILGNLLDNACRYTPSGGKISVALCRDQGHALISVTDDGDGIPPPMLDKVFALFTQLNVTIDRKRGGLGIGLTLVKTLVQMHEGSVRALSEGPGKGSRFEVRLPLTAEREVAAETARPAAGRRRRLSLLVVEDNTDAREMLSELLVSWGHDVVAEADGKAGLARGLRQRFDAAIIDIGLPLLDGYSLARQLKAQRPDDHPYMIALTGYGAADERSRSAQAGFSLHVVKPVDVDLLERVLSDLRIDSRDDRRLAEAAVRA